MNRDYYAAPEGARLTSEATSKAVASAVADAIAVLAKSPAVEITTKNIIEGLAIYAGTVLASEVKTPEGLGAFSELLAVTTHNQIVESRKLRLV